MTDDNETGVDWEKFWQEMTGPSNDVISEGAVNPTCTGTGCFVDFFLLSEWSDTGLGTKIWFAGFVVFLVGLLSADVYIYLAEKKRNIARSWTTQRWSFSTQCFPWSLGNSLTAGGLGSISSFLNREAASFIWILFCGFLNAVFWPIHPYVYIFLVYAIAMTVSNLYQMILNTLPFGKTVNQDVIDDMDDIGGELD